MGSVMPTTGLERVAQLIVDDTPYVACGSDATEPVVGNTTLNTETNRLIATTALRSSKTAEIRAFFLNSQLPATMEEIGLFLNGTAVVDTGSLAVHGLSNFVKGSQDALIIVKVTISEL